MSKKEKPASPQEQTGGEQPAVKGEPETSEQTEPAEEKTAEVSETFTVTREQMEKMEALAGQLAAGQDKYLRLAAEYDNYRKRTAREKESAYQDAKIETIRSFLAVYDNLERAVQQAGDEENVHKKGMEMIFHQLETILEQLGVTIEDPINQPFDPLRHSAVMHIDDENLGEGVVSQVFQKGFLLGGKVIRFASVQVAN